MPFECGALIFILLNLSGLPFFFGFYIKHLVVAGAVIAPVAQLISIFSFTAATTGLLYSFKVIYYTFFDTKKARKSTYNEINRIELGNKYYSNSATATLAVITGLLMTAYTIIMVLFYQKLVLALPSLDSNLTVLYSSAPNTTVTDNAVLFNGAAINWVILIIASILVVAR